MKSKFNKSKKYDQQNSTFSQTIYLSNGKQFFGWSKKLGYNEKADKIGLLKNWILRMYNAGYLNKNSIGTQKEIQELQYFLNDHLKVPILSLEYQSYTVLNPEWCTANFKIIQFLDVFYKYINEGKEYKISRLFDYSKPNKINQLDTTLKKFLTYKALYSWIKQEVEKKNFTQSELTNYYNEYLRIHLPEDYQRINSKKQ